MAETQGYNNEGGNMATEEMERLIKDIFFRVDGDPVNSDLIMDVRTGGHAGITDSTDNVFP